MASVTALTFVFTIEAAFMVHVGTASVDAASADAALARSESNSEVTYCEVQLLQMRANKGAYRSQSSKLAPAIIAGTSRRAAGAAAVDATEVLPRVGGKRTTRTAGTPQVSILLSVWLNLSYRHERSRKEKEASPMCRRKQLPHVCTSFVVPLAHVDNACAGHTSMSMEIPVHDGTRGLVATIRRQEPGHSKVLHEGLPAWYIEAHMDGGFIVVRRDDQDIAFATELGRGKIGFGADAFVQVDSVVAADSPEAGLVLICVLCVLTFDLRK